MRSALLIDDNQVLLETLTKFLEHKVKVVDTALTSRSGIEKAKRLLPDLILLDLSMPELSGIEALPLIKEAVPLSRIIVLTTHEEDYYKEISFDLGADGFVMKQNMAKMLQPEIERVFAE